jgi:hypothetical protein
MAKKKTARTMPKLTEVEQDLLSQMQNGYQLETGALWVAIRFCEG